MELEDGQDHTVGHRNNDIDFPERFSESQDGKDLGCRVQQAIAFTFLLQVIPSLFEQVADLMLAMEGDVYVEIRGRLWSGSDWQQEV